MRDGFAAVLGRDRVGGGEDFFALGGDSLAVQRLRVRLRGQLSGDINTRLIFTHTTPAALAEALIARDARPTPAAGTGTGTRTGQS